MIVSKVRFTGFELVPTDVTDRWHRGVIPAAWKRVRFLVPAEVDFPISTANRWLFSHLDDRWAVTMRFVHEPTGNLRELTVAFENDREAVTFVLADGPNQMFN